MLKKLKRVIALMMVVVLSTSSLISCKKDETQNETSKTKEASTTTVTETITRGEWITLLAEAYGMVQYDSATPYYSDVKADNPIFAYVQSCYEWNVLSTGTDKFNPDEDATLGFVISTAVLAAELDYEEYATSDDVNESIINCANACGLTSVKYSESDKLTAKAEKFGAQSILVASVAMFMDTDVKDIVNIEYKDTVVDAASEEATVENITVIGSNTKVPAAEADMVQEGSVLLLPANDENPFGYCLKVVSKTLNSDGTYTIVTEEPSIDEVFDKIEVDTEMAATSDMFEPAEGVTVIKKEEASNIENLDYVVDVKPLGDDLSDISSDITTVKKFESEESDTIELSVDFEFDGKDVEVSGGLKVNNLGLTIKPTNEEALDRFDKALEAIGKVDDKLCKENDYSFVNDFVKGELDEKEFEKKLKEAEKKVETKVESEDKKGETKFKVSGKISLKTTVSVKAEVDFFLGIPTELEEFSVEVKNEADTELSFEGSYKKTKKLGSFKIPLAYGFGLKLQADLVFDAKGNVTVGYSVDSSIKVSYDGKKVKKTNTNTYSDNVSASVSAEGGLKLSGTIEFWGLGLAELAVKITAKLEVKGKVERSFDYVIEEVDGEQCYILTDRLDAETSCIFYIPLITFSLGGDDTLLGWIGIELEYEFVDEDKAAKLKIWEFDSTKDNDNDGQPDSLIIYQEIIPIPKEEETTTEEETTIEEETTTEEETTVEEETTKENDDTKTGTMSLSEFVVTLDVGQTVTLTATLPEGYSSADIVWSVDGGAATVSNGVVTAVSSGNVIVKAVTKDGKYEAACTVIVN